MKPGTLFINTARSEVIESGALLARLHKGDVPAALDVFDHVRLTADDATDARTIPDDVLGELGLTAQEVGQ